MFLWPIADSFMLIQRPGHASCQEASQVAVELPSLWRLIECLMIVKESGKADLVAKKKAAVPVYQKNVADGGLGMSRRVEGKRRAFIEITLHCPCYEAEPTWLLRVHEMDRNFIMLALSLHSGRFAGPVVSGVWQEAGMMMMMKGK